MRDGNTINNEQRRTFIVFEKTTHPDPAVVVHGTWKGCISLVPHPNTETVRALSHIARRRIEVNVLDVRKDVLQRDVGGWR